MEEETPFAPLPDPTNGGDKAKQAPAYDDILREIGEFGAYQILAGLTVGFAFAFGSLVTMNFLFGADALEHRCWIPECEPIDSSAFHADWLGHAVPYSDGAPDPCSRFEYIGSADGVCSEHNFNRSQVVGCDGFISKNNEQRLLSHLDLLCRGQNNEMALLGTVSSLGRIIAMPIAGFLSDKYGRLITITASATLGAIFSALQALPSHLMSFELYLAFEFLASLLSTGMIGAGYVYLMEWTTGKYRVRLITMALVMEILLPYSIISWAAWYYADNFVAYRLVSAVPGFLMLALHFLLGESPQWLLAQNKSSEALKSLSKAAKINRRPVHADTVDRIERLSALSAKGVSVGEQATTVSIVDVLRHKTLTLRLLITSLVFLCIFFAYYGIFLGSTRAHNNKYFSFALIGFADIPGTIINELLLDRIGRRPTVAISLAVYSVLLAASTQLPADQQLFQLILFVAGKAAVMAACAGFNTFAAEFWPTATRNTASNIGIMAGRIGSMLASVAVLLAHYYRHLPIFLNAAAGLLGSVLVFAFLPETLHCTKLPDTIDEAVHIGRARRRTSGQSAKTSGMNL